MDPVVVVSLGQDGVLMGCVVGTEGVLCVCVCVCVFGEWCVCLWGGG